MFFALENCFSEEKLFLFEQIFFVFKNPVFYILKYVFFMKIFFHKELFSVPPPTPQKNVFWKKRFTVNNNEVNTLWCFFHSIIYKNLFFSKKTQKNVKKN